MSTNSATQPSDDPSSVTTKSANATAEASGGRAAAVQRKARFPWTMSILTVLVIFAGWISRVFISEIEDAIHLGLDVIMVLTLVVASVMMVLWLGWFLLFSRWRWTMRLTACAMLLMLPVALLKVFRPVHGGDTNFVRFEPIWASKPAPLPTDSKTESGVDLTTESPSDFPRFLGSRQNGEVSGIVIDASKFVTDTKTVWKQSSGLGWSGFAARNGFAVTMEQRADKECVTCYEVATGQLKWIYSYSARHLDTINLGRVGPRATPTIHNGNVYAVGAVGNFVCLRGSDGTVIWQKNLNELLGIKLGERQDADGLATQYEENANLSWGRSGAPLVVDETIVVPGGGPAGERRATLLAFDLLTGELRWKSGDEMIAYGSPVLATVAGQRQIMMTAETQVMGFDPVTGQVMWQYARPGQSDGAANTSQVNVVSDTDVLVSKGYPDGGGDRIHLEHVNGTWTATAAWASTKVLKTKLTSPVIHEGFAYCLSNGFMECVQLSDGKQMWKRRGRFGHGQALLVGKHLLLHSESGELFLVEATPDEYRQLGVVKTIDGVCWNTLCLIGNRLLVRSELEAACLEIPVVGSAEL
jgi:outer membrane protein assembly factor BamB